jgi:hypothetical protein
MKLGRVGLVLLLEFFSVSDREEDFFFFSALPLFLNPWGVTRQGMESSDSVLDQVASPSFAPFSLKKECLRGALWAK